MEWNVLYYDFNARKIRTYNVLSGQDAHVNNLKKKFKSKESFAKQLRSEMMYHYWSKCEWEIIVSAWCGADGKESIKIDVWDQINLNWEHFVNYVWNYADKK